MSKLYIFLLPENEPVADHRWHSLIKTLQQRCHMVHVVSMSFNDQVNLDEVILSSISQLIYLGKEVVVVMLPASFKENHHQNASIKKKIILISDTQSHFKQIVP